MVNTEPAEHLSISNIIFTLPDSRFHHFTTPNRCKYSFKLRARAQQLADVTRLSSLDKPAPLPQRCKLLLSRVTHSSAQVWFWLSGF